jgi:hypothetical protein
MGPSRVNPFTGEILDADIIFDASFLRYWKHDYETFTPEDVAQLMGGGPLSNPELAKSQIPQGLPVLPKLALDPHTPSVQQSCSLGVGMQQQMGFAAAALMAQGATGDKGKLPDKFIHQAIKEVVMHEVGHTLGLRHNFKASSWKSLEEINKLPIDATEATVASVMDYAPANIALNKEKQGPYYTATLGPYDYWAIEYGYSTDATDDAALKKIASRGGEKGLDYSTDEDTRSTDSDPLTNRFDLGENPINFAQLQMELSAKLMDKVLERSVEDGAGYQRARQAFGLLLSEYWRSAFFAARFPGGVHVHRDHKGDPNQRAPFEAVAPAQQRDAMKLLAETAFGTPSYDPKLLNHLAASRWSHWGMNDLSRLDYPIHDTIGMMQGRLLGQLLSGTTLTRLHDSELKVDSFEAAGGNRSAMTRVHVSQPPRRCWSAALRSDGARPPSKSCWSEPRSGCSPLMNSIAMPLSSLGDTVPQQHHTRNALSNVRLQTSTNAGNRLLDERIRHPAGLAGLSSWLGFECEVPARTKPS